MKNTTRKSLSLLVSFVLTASSLGQPALAAAGQIVAGRVVLPGNISGYKGTIVSAPFRSTTDFKLPTPLVGLRYNPAPTVGPSVGAAEQFTAPTEVQALSALEFQQAAALGFTKSANADRKGVFGILREKISAALKLDSSLGSIFDSSRVQGPTAVAGVTGKPIKLPIELQGIVLGPAPQAPNPKDVSGISLLGFDIPGTKGLGGIFEQGAAVLSADPTKTDEVEKALRGLVDADKARFGVPSAELKTIHVKRIEGVGNQADTVYALFRQQKDGVEMDGSYLQFTIKVINGQARIMAAKAQLYPDVQLEGGTPLSDEVLKARAAEGIQLPQSMADRLEQIGRKVIYSDGRWVTANLYTIEGLPFMIAVNVYTGEAFAWDSHMGLLDNVPVATGGKLDGRTVDKGPTRPDSKLTSIPLANVTITFDNGQKTVTDNDGKFVVPGSADMKNAPKSFKAGLSGVYAVINDEERKDLKVSGELKPGETMTITFNPSGDANDENAIAQISAYRLVNRVHDWAKARGIDEKSLDVALPVNVNIDDECNAYYTPGRPSLNFFKSSRDCSNSAYDTVAMHEWGHFADDMLGGIVNGGLSEGFGDIFSMYILGNPIIGEGFLKNRNPSYIRHGENKYQYNEYDEVHDQGQAWMGFAWKLRQALIASLNEAGAAVAETIVLPTLYAKATSIPEAIAQVLLNDMDKQGNLPHEKEIRAAAAAHGITLPKNPGSLLAQFVRKLMPSYYGVSSLSEQKPTAATVAGVPGVSTLVAGVEATKPAAADGNPVVKKTYEFWAGALVRKDVRYAIERYLSSQTDITYKLLESRSWSRSDYTLVIEGPQKSVEKAVRWVDRLLSQNSGFRDSSPGTSTVALTGAWSDKLQAWPERGMGYQKVDVTLKDGTVLRNLTAMNSSTLALPAGVAAFAEADILALREAASGNAAEELVNATVTFSAGALIRSQVAAEVRRFCDHHLAKGDFKSYALHEARGWLSSDFTLDINGKDSVIDLLIEQLRKHRELRRSPLSLAEPEALAGSPKFGVTLNAKLAYYLAGGRGVVGVQYDDDLEYSKSRELFDYARARGLQVENHIDGGFVSFYGVSLQDLQHFASLSYVLSVDVDPWGTRDFEHRQAGR